MSAPSHSGGAPVTDKRQLVEYLAGGCKPRAEWRIGTEHEKFIFRRADLHPVPYEGDSGIRAILEKLQRFGWQPVLDSENMVGLTDDSGGAISLEPGGQFELSGAPVETLHQTCNELHTHLKQMREVTGELGLGMLGLGFLPKWKREDCFWMPKRRYAVMRNYMPKKGKLGIDMMLRTCTVQVNLDFASEADMVLKSRASLALQPIATALFANSPFFEGKPSGFVSLRSNVWTDTDPDRCGMLPFVFEDGFGFERYVEWMLDVPMYFIYRDGNYIDVAGQSFRDFLAGKLPGRPGEIPTIGDWSDHLTTAFPEIRIKKFIEMRGADGGPWRNLCALPAFWTGLLYDDDALRAAWDLVKDWSAEEREQLRADVPRLGLETLFRGKKIQEIAIAAVQIAKAGLKRRAHLNGEGDDETIFLQPVIEAAESGKTPADTLLDEYATRWRGIVDPVYVADAY
jgi:glutamate--cysteine ligase